MVSVLRHLHTRTNGTVENSLRPDVRRLDDRPRLLDLRLLLRGDQILDHRGGAAIGDELEAGAGIVLEVSSDDVRAAADPTDSHGCLARVLLHPSDQFPEILWRQSSFGNEPHRTVGDQRYRL